MKPTVGHIAFGPGMGTKADLVVEVSTKAAQAALREAGERIAELEAELSDMRKVVEALANHEPLQIHVNDEGEDIGTCTFCGGTGWGSPDHAEGCAWTLARRLTGKEP